MSLSISALGGYDTFYPIYSAAPVNRADAVDRVSRDSGNTKTESGDKVKKGECQTCAKRKYVDGSNAKVMAHEQEHVANAIAEGSKPNKELISATVSLHTSVCPECGRTYVSGGNTHTVMRTTSDTSNPYAELQQRMNRNFSAGLNFDMSA